MKKPELLMHVKSCKNATIQGTMLKMTQRFSAIFIKFTYYWVDHNMEPCKCILCKVGKFSSVQKGDVLDTDSTPSALWPIPRVLIVADKQVSPDVVFCLETTSRLCQLVPSEFNWNQTIKLRTFHSNYHLWSRARYHLYSVIAVR